MRRVSWIVVAVLLAGCSRGSFAPPAQGGFAGGAQAGWPMSPDKGYALLYPFQAGSDGAYPYDGLTALGGQLYGTTYGGGSSYGWGTVFKASTTGAETVLYRFQANSDGAHPYDALVALNGTLYGTTQQGGTGGAGTVFSITPSGKEHVIYSFKGGSDGQYPYSRLLVVGSDLYGTTYQGGSYPGWGVVFKVSPSGTEKVLYRFQANKDGAHPYAGLTALGATLYGTTYQGGTKGSGTVFSITPAGTEKVIYSFKGGTDGQYPYSRLAVAKGVLYGTTYQGGVYPGWGVVFGVTPAGKEHVVYSFKANSDGAHPQLAGLVALNGSLYGTTYQGGAHGAGTVFKVGLGGGEQVLYGFKGGSDGQYPYAGLTDVGGSLYGTTNVGGSASAGTIFKILP